MCATAPRRGALPKLLWADLFRHVRTHKSRDKLVDVTLELLIFIHELNNKEHLVVSDIDLERAMERPSIAYN